MAKKLYPIFINMEGIQCLVVGGGKVALRKIDGLLETGARILVSAPYVCPKILSLAAEGFVEILKQEKTYDKVDRQDPDLSLYHELEERALESCRLCYIATDNREENQRLALLCQKKGVLYNVVDLDAPTAGGFTVPSTRKAGDFQLAVCTKGNPGASMAAADLLMEEFSEGRTEYFQFTGELRKKLKTLTQDKELRQSIMRRLHEKELLKLAGTDLDKAKRRAEKIVELALGIELKK